MVQEVLRVKVTISKSSIKGNKLQTPTLPSQSEELNRGAENWISIFKGYMLGSFGRFCPITRLKLGALKQLKSLVISDIFYWSCNQQAWTTDTWVWSGPIIKWAHSWLRAAHYSLYSGPPITKNSTTQMSAAVTLPSVLQLDMTISAVRYFLP